MDPHIEQCVSHVQELMIKPAFKQTVTTTYYKRKERLNNYMLASTMHFH